MLVVNCLPRVLIPDHARLIMPGLSLPLPSGMSGRYSSGNSGRPGDMGAAAAAACLVRMRADALIGASNSR